MLIDLKEAHSLRDRLIAQPDLTTLNWLLALTVDIAAAIKEVEKGENEASVVTITIMKQV